VTVTEPRLISHVGRVRIDQCVSAVRAVEVQVFLCNLSCFNETHRWPEYEQSVSQSRFYRKTLKYKTHEVVANVLQCMQNKAN
jgi:hypothetical protein